MESVQLFHEILKSHNYPIIKLKYLETNKQLVSIDFKGFIRIWDLEKKEILKKFNLKFESEVQFAETSNKFLYLNLDSGVIVIMNLNTGDIIGKFYGHESPISAIHFATNSFFLSGSIEGSIIIWERINFEITKVLQLDGSIGFMDSYGKNQLLILVGENNLIVMDCFAEIILKEKQLGKFSITKLIRQDDMLYWGCTYGNLNCVNLVKFFEGNAVIERRKAH